MKNALLAAALAALFATPALAEEDCKKDIEQIDAALAKAQLPPDEQAEVTDMRSQAVQLCGAGNVQEGLDVTSEAKARLNIE
jgi:hypothetical protein